MATPKPGPVKVDLTRPNGRKELDVEWDDPRRHFQDASAFHAEVTKPKPESASVYLILTDRRILGRIRLCEVNVASAN